MAFLTPARLRHRQLASGFRIGFGDCLGKLGTNAFLREFSDRFGVPYDATRGGAETMYPEYMQKVAAMPKPVKK